jgi:Leucine-rich repeat (LRR) protein
VTRTDFDALFIEYAEITGNKFKIIINGNKNRSNVKSIRFEGCNLAKFPDSKILLDVVQDLTYLELYDCKITKITREDLCGLESLKNLFMGLNNIEQLPKGLFDFTPNLEIISFLNNKIKDIDADILDPLKDLKYFNLSNNASINVKYDSVENKGNVNLEKLKKAIKKCDPVKKFMVEINMEIETVKKEISELKKKIESVEKENATVKEENVKIQKKMDSVEKENVKINKEIDSVKKENQSLKRKFGELETSYNELKNDFKRLKEMKEKQIICDFTVSINGKAFHVNKEILSANSPVLKKLIDENHDADHLELHDISEKTFEAILNFMYSKNPPNNATNLTELFAASARLQMKELMNMTAEILMKKVTPNNAADIIKLCQKYKHVELSKKAFNELKKNFPDE